MSDMVISHGMAEAMGEKDVLEAHKKFLPELGPVANKLSEFTFGFAAAIFRKYIGDELTATVVAKFENAPNIDDVTLPFYIEMSPSKDGVLGTSI